MTPAQIVLTSLLVTALLLQALVPSARVMIVLSAAGLSCLGVTLFGLGTTRQLLAEVPWDVIVILVGLGLLSEVFVAARLFGVLAVASARGSRADPRQVVTYFAAGMYVVSGLVNNLTALILVLPVLHILLRLIGVRQRFVSWTLGVLLVACNLGGAATPIGDFPAILLLGSGSMTFRSYLLRAAPATLVALLALLAVTRWVVRPERGLDHGPVAARLSLAVMSALHRNVRLDRRYFVPAAAALAAMLAAWVLVPATSGVSPELICWLGVAAALLAAAQLGERLVRTRVDIEAALFLLALFVMVGAVRRTGMFGGIARALTALPVAPLAQLVVFLLMAGVLTGLFSAGPSMAALLEVAPSLTTRLPPAAVYVGLALSVCAGSSLFLTAATSGPMAQALTERADLRDPDGARIRFGFFDFLPTGLMSFAIIQSVAIAYAFVEIALSRR